MNGWISIKDKKPEPMKDVIVCFKSGRISVETMFYSGNFTLEKLYGKVTHWMPLPEPPKGDK